MKEATARRLTLAGLVACALIACAFGRVVVAFVAFVSTIGDARATPTRPNAHAVSAHSAHSARGAVAIDARARVARRSRGIARGDGLWGWIVARRYGVARRRAAVRCCSFVARRAIRGETTMR